MQPGGQPDLGQLMQQAQELQQQITQAQERLADAEVTGSAGGGAVRVVLAGTGEVTSVHIDPSAVDPADTETLEDLVLAALRHGADQVRELTEATLGPLAGGMGGLGLPGM